MHGHISKKLIGLFFLGITGFLLVAGNTWAGKKAGGTVTTVPCQQS